MIPNAKNQSNLFLVEADDAPWPGVYQTERYSSAISAALAGRGFA